MNRSLKQQRSKAAATVNQNGNKQTRIQLLVKYSVKKMGIKKTELDAMKSTHYVCNHLLLHAKFVVT